MTRERLELGFTQRMSEIYENMQLIQKGLTTKGRLDSVMLKSVQDDLTQFQADLPAEYNDSQFSKSLQVRFTWVADVERIAIEEFNKRLVTLKENIDNLELIPNLLEKYAEREGALQKIFTSYERLKEVHLEYDTVQNNTMKALEETVDMIMTPRKSALKSGGYGTFQNDFKGRYQAFLRTRKEPPPLVSEDKGSQEGTLSKIWNILKG